MPLVECHGPLIERLSETFPEQDLASRPRNEDPRWETAVRHSPEPWGRRHGPTTPQVTRRVTFEELWDEATGSPSALPIP